MTDHDGSGKADFKEWLIRVLLAGAWDDYTKAIATGELREVEAKYSNLITEIVRDIVQPRELAGGDVANS